MHKPVCVSCGASLLGEREGEILCVVDEKWRLFCLQCAEALSVTPLSSRVGHAVLRESFAWESEEERTGGGVCTGCGKPLNFGEQGSTRTAVDDAIESPGYILVRDDEAEFE